MDHLICSVWQTQVVGVTTMARMRNSTEKALKGHVAPPSHPATLHLLPGPATGDISIAQPGQLRLREIKHIASSFEENTRQRWDSEHSCNSQTHGLSPLREKEFPPWKWIPMFSPIDTDNCQPRSALPAPRLRSLSAGSALFSS